MLSLALGLLALIVPLQAQGGWCYPPPEYAFALSASSENPGVNHVATVSSEFSLYLWMTCTAGAESQGALIFEAIVETEYGVVEFEPMNGWLSTGDADTLLMTNQCASSPSLMGRWTLENPQALSSGDVCLRSGPDFPAPAPSCWVADCCEVPHWPEGDIAGVHGFAVGDAKPCSDDHGCTEPTALNPRTWGRVKARFRTPSN